MMNLACRRIKACYGQMRGVLLLTDSVFPAPLGVFEWPAGAGIERRNVPLTRDDDSLTSAISAHGGVGILRDGEQVRLKFTSPAAVVRLDDFRTIEGDALEGIDGNEDDSGVRVDAVLAVTIADGVKD